MCRPHGRGAREDDGYEVSHRPASGRRLCRRHRRRPGFGRWSPGILGSLPAFADTTTTSRAETYRLLTLFGDVFERVRAEYVDPVTDRTLIENALNGMLTGLDPHSDYMNAQAVAGHAGADAGRVRRPRPRGHAGIRSDQGRQPDRRHARRPCRHQAGRPDHRAQRQDRGGHQPQRRRRRDARAAQQHDPPDAQATGRSTRRSRSRSRARSSTSRSSKAGWTATSAMSA